MGLRREAENIGYLLHRVGRRSQFPFYLPHDVFVYDCLWGLTRDAAGNLGEIAAAHIELVSIEMHIAVGAAEVVHLRDKLVIEFGATTLQIALTGEFHIDEILRHRQGILHLLALVQINGKGRRKTVEYRS